MTWRKPVPIYPEPNFKIIGHRGAPTLAPENTLASFAVAAQYGLNWVEFDTMRLNTGEWVVIHDDTLNRTTTGTGPVMDKSIEYLKTLDAGSWFSPDYQNERIPLLKEALDFLSALRLYPNIEIKTMPLDPLLVIPSFLACLEAHWPQTESLPLISSFDLTLLLTVQKLQKKPYPLGYIIKEFTFEALEIALQHGFTTLNCDHRYIQPEQIREIQTHPISLLLYTINDPGLARQFFEQGVSAVFSNHPDLLTES
jgi:glycerophosphoryl diester phosphodiesterase